MRKWRRRPVGRLSEQGTARGSKRRPQLDEGGREPGGGGWEPEHGTEPVAYGVQREAGYRWRGAGKAGVRRGLHAIHEAAEESEPGDAVGKDMVEHHEQRGLIVSDAGHEPGGPEGTIPRKPGRQQIGSDPEHGLLVCRSGAKNDGEVVVDSEFRIVHPHGSTAPEGYVDQPLTKSRNRC